MAIGMHNATISLDNSGGTPVNITGQANGVTINYEKTLGAFHTLDTVWNGALEGGITTRIQLMILETAPAAEGHGLIRDAMINGGARTLTVSVPDTSPGSLQYSGEIRIGGMSPAHSSRANSGDPVITTAECLGDGDWEPSVIT